MQKSQMSETNYAQVLRFMSTGVNLCKCVLPSPGAGDGMWRADDCYLLRCIHCIDMYGRVILWPADNAMVCSYSYSTSQAHIHIQFSVSRIQWITSAPNCCEHRKSGWWLVLCIIEYAALYDSMTVCLYECRGLYGYIKYASHPPDQVCRS